MISYIHNEKASMLSIFHVSLLKPRPHTRPIKSHIWQNTGISSFGGSPGDSDDSSVGTTGFMAFYSLHVVSAALASGSDSWLPIRITWEASNQ